MIIAVDFDGTCVTSDFPKVGKDIGAQYVLKELIKQGHKLILFTVRGNSSKTWDGRENNELFLTEAYSWFATHEIELWGINENPQQEKEQWTDSPKPFYNVLIDGYALGCPLVKAGKHQFVDWKQVFLQLIECKILDYEQDPFIISSIFSLIAEDIKKLKE